MELLDGWGNAHDLRGWAVRVLLRQLRRQEEEEARAAAGQAGSSGQGAVGGWTCDQEWTVHLLKVGIAKRLTAAGQGRAKQLLGSMPLLAKTSAVLKSRLGASSN